MTDDSLLPRRVALACLIAAPLCELVEQLLSPLTGSSTVSDLHAIADHRGIFVASVLIGLAGTVLYVPAFLGLAGACLRTSPVAAWRSGLPRPAVVLLALFPFVDLGAKGHVGTVVSHAVLLVALAWLAVGLGRSTPRLIDQVATA